MSKKKLGNFGFRCMALLFNFSRKTEKIMEILKELPLKNGDIIVDYGAGTGSYGIIAAKMIYPDGHLYSADIHPLSEEYVLKKAKSSGITNISTITTDCELPINDDSVDFVFIFDVIHNLTDLRRNLEEFKRVLKKTGILVLIVDHDDPEIVVKKIENFQIFKRDKTTAHLFYFIQI